MVDNYLVATNTITGRFKLSNDAIVRLSRKGHIMATESLGARREKFDDSKLLRHDPILVEVIQELGRKASADGSSIWLTRISNPHYKVKKFDGIETIREYPSAEDAPGCITIVKDDHLSQYNFEGLEERLAAEEAAREASLEAIRVKVKEIQEQKLQEEAAKSTKKKKTTTKSKKKEVVK